MFATFNYFLGGFFQTNSNPRVETKLDPEPAGSDIADDTDCTVEMVQVQSAEESQEDPHQRMSLAQDAGGVSRPHFITVSHVQRRVFVMSIDAFISSPRALREPHMCTFLTTLNLELDTQHRSPTSASSTIGTVA